MSVSSFVYVFNKNLKRDNEIKNSVSEDTFLLEN